MRAFSPEPMLLFDLVLKSQYPECAVRPAKMNTLYGPPLPTVRFVPVDSCTGPSVRIARFPGRTLLGGFNVQGIAPIADSCTRRLPVVQLVMAVAAEVHALAPVNVCWA